MKRLFLFVVVLFVSLNLFSQSFINGDDFKVIWGTPKDTITSTPLEKIASFTVADFCSKALLAGKVVAKSGTTYSVKFYLEKSFDYNTWSKVDSVTLSNTTTAVFSNSIKDVNAPYIRVRTAKVSGTYTLYPYVYLLVDSNK